MIRQRIQTTQKKQIIDITDQITKELQKNPQAKELCSIFVLHTTAAITTADLDPGTDADMLDAFQKLIPDLPYRHPHNPKHVPDHILSSIIDPSVTIPIENNQLVLGLWQRIILIEFDGPREREIGITWI